MIRDLKTRKIIYESYEIINFININSSEKMEILKWRNNENTRKWMLNKNIITFEEHDNYIESLKNKKDKLCFLVKERNEYIGVIEFNKIDFLNKCAFFGINKNFNSEIKNIGKKLELLSTYLAKELMKLNKLELFVLKNNHKAIALYEEVKYKVIKKDFIDNEEILYMEKKL